MSSEDEVVSVDAEDGERRENGLRRDMSGRVEKDE